MTDCWVAGLGFVQDWMTESGHNQRTTSAVVFAARSGDRASTVWLPPAGCRILQERPPDREPRPPNRAAARFRVQRSGL